MTLLGFNAEISLYRTSVGYRSRRTAVRLAGAVPQLVDAPGYRLRAVQYPGVANLPQLLDRARKVSQLDATVFADIPLRPPQPGFTCPPGNFCD
jgi:hypothetical protein